MQKWSDWYGCLSVALLLKGGSDLLSESAMLIGNARAVCLHPLAEQIESSFFVAKMSASFGENFGGSQRGLDGGYKVPSAGNSRDRDSPKGRIFGWSERLAK
jgi:hypothetical protein